MKTIVSNTKGTHNGRCRLSDAELCRVMSAHSNKQLCTGGSFGFGGGQGCLLQVALNEAEGNSSTLAQRLAKRAGSKTVRGIIRAFDDQYDPSWTPSRLVKFLTRHGVA